MTTEMGETWKLEAHKNNIIMKFKVSLGLIALTKIRKILGGKFISKGGHIIKEDDFISLAVKHTDAKNLTDELEIVARTCLLYTSPSPRDKRQSRMPSSA